MKKLLLLGGLRYLVPVIQSAHELGHYVITCDNVPYNTAHRYADEYHNVSIIDKDAILELAIKLQIDGIMSFAVDPGVITAAYVAEKLSLPFAGSYESVKILQNKDLFRAFLTQHGFNTPKSGGYVSLKEALKEIDKFSFPVIVKPVDSAGSKGVTRIDDINELEGAVAKAIQFSFSERFIIEEFIEQRGYSSDSDCFSVAGKLVFCTFSDQMFEPKAMNPYTPAGFTWPNSMLKSEQQFFKSELQRLLDLLQLQSSIYNIETRVSVDGTPYIMEVSPRGGGNRISEILKLSTGVDTIRASVQLALGEAFDFPEEFNYDGVWSELILYSDKKGFFSHIEIEKEIRPYLVSEDIWVTQGDKVNPFTGANETLGTLIFHFSSRETYLEIWPKIRGFVNIYVKDYKE